MESSQVGWSSPFHYWVNDTVWDDMAALVRSLPATGLFGPKELRTSFTCVQRSGQETSGRSPCSPFGTGPTWMRATHEDRLHPERPVPRRRRRMDTRSRRCARPRGRAGHKVSLWLPRRRQPTAEMALTSVYDAYGLERSFDVESFRTSMLVHFGGFAVRIVGPFLFGLQSRLWARAAARHVVASDVDLCFTRGSVDRQLSWRPGAFRSSWSCIRCRRGSDEMPSCASSPPPRFITSLR